MPNNNNTIIPISEIRQNTEISIIIKFERLKKNNLITSILCYLSESGNICLGTSKDPNVNAKEIPNIYHRPKE